MHYPGGVYKNKLSVFEELEEMGVRLAIFHYVSLSFAIFWLSFAIFPCLSLS